MADLAKLVIKLEAQSAKLQSGLASAENRAKKWERKTKKSISAVKIAFAALAVGIAAVKLKNMVTEQIAAADAIGKTADILGISTKSLQTYRFAASQSGVANSVMEKGLKNMVVVLADYQKGIGEAKSELEKLGFTQQELAGMTPDQQFAAIADRLKDVKDNTDRVSIAYKIFGGRATALLNIIRDGSKGLADYGDQAERAGLVIEDSLIRNAESANNRIDVLTKKLQTQLTIAVIQNAKEIEAFTESLIKMAQIMAQIPSFVKFISDSFHNAFGDPQNIVHVNDAIYESEKRLSLLSDAIAKGNERGGWVNGTFLNLDELSRRIAVVAGKLDGLYKKQAEFSAKTPTLTIPKTQDPNAGGGNIGGGQSVDMPKDIGLRQIGGGVDITAISESLKTKEQLFEDSYERQKLQVEQWISEDFTRQQEGDFLLMQLSEQHEAQKTAIAKKGRAERLALISAELGAAANIFSGLSSLMAKEGKKQSAMQKILGKASIIASTAQAVMNALAVPPYPLGLALAAGAAIEGANQLKNLGTSSAGISGPGQSLQSPSGFAQDTLASNVQPQQTQAQEININITGGLADRDTAETIAESLREFFANGGRQFA